MSLMRTWPQQLVKQILIRRNIYLSSDISKQVLNVFPDKGVLHDGLSVLLKQEIGGLWEKYL